MSARTIKQHGERDEEVQRAAGQDRRAARGRDRNPPLEPGFPVAHQARRERLADEHQPEHHQAGEDVGEERARAAKLEPLGRAGRPLDLDRQILELVEDLELLAGAEEPPRDLRHLVFRGASACGRDRVDGVERRLRPREQTVRDRGQHLQHAANDFGRDGLRGVRHEPDLRGLAVEERLLESLRHDDQRRSLAALETAARGGHIGGRVQLDVVGERSRPDEPRDRGRGERPVLVEHEHLDRRQLAARRRRRERRVLDPGERERDRHQQEDETGVPEDPLEVMGRDDRRGSHSRSSRPVSLMNRFSRLGCLTATSRTSPSSAAIGRSADSWRSALARLTSSSESLTLISWTIRQRTEGYRRPRRHGTSRAARRSPARPPPGAARPACPRRESRRDR